jgi:hypothetical protein
LIDGHSIKITIVTSLPGSFKVVDIFNNIMLL